MSNNPVDHVVFDLMKLQTKINKRIGGALSIHGLGLSDYFVLNQLYAAPSQKLRRSDLAEQVGLTPSGITRLLNPLEKIGLVEKELNARDARVSLVALSDSGRRIYKDAKTAFLEASKTVFGGQSDAAVDSFSRVLKALK